MGKSEMMGWIDALPNVQNTDFQERRDGIKTMMAEAAEFVRKAEELRGKAYFAALSLEGSAKTVFSAAAVDEAKRKSSW